MTAEAARPFYGRFAWAYDLLSARPVAAECAHIASMIGGRGLPAGALLNDLIDDRVRQAAFVALAGALARGGALVFDVRDWAATARRKSRDPSTRRPFRPRGLVTFRSETRLEPATRQLGISEQHRLTAGDRTIRADDAFVMRCWTRDELDGLLSTAGFADIAYRGPTILPYPLALPIGSS